MKLRYLGLRHLQRKGRFLGHGTYNWTVALNTLGRLFRAGFRCVRVQLVMVHRIRPCPRRRLHQLVVPMAWHPGRHHVRWSLAETAVKYRIEPYRQSKRATRGTLR